MEYAKKIIPEFLSGGGEMGELIRTKDWSKSSLGYPEEWPQSLRTSVSICLNSSCPLLIWWSVDLIKIYNDAYRDLIGAKHPKAMGSKGAEVWAEVWHIVSPDLKGILNNGESTSANDQLLIIERNGHPQECYFTFSNSAIRDETGNIGGVFCVVTETTKKVFTERHPSTQLKNLFLQAPVAICILRGKEYVIEVINERMADMWDRRIEDVLNKPAFDILKELRNQGFKELLDNVFFKGERFVAEELPINLKRNGKIENAFVKFIYEPLLEEDGTISGVMALAHEITEQVAARKRIEVSEAKFRQVTNLMPGKITNTDATGKVFYYNQAWIDYTGLSFEELINSGWDKMIHPAELSKLQAQWKLAIETGKEIDIEIRILNKKGNYKWHHSRSSAVKDDAGKIKMWISVTTEIQKIKDEEQRKDNFIKMVSHELKTPVTSIKGYVQLLLTMIKEEHEVLLSPIPIKLFLTRIDKLILRLSTLITELLDLSRIEADKLELKKELFNLNELIIEAVEDMQFTNPKHIIKIHHDFKCNIYADKGRIAQVAINLITNALKYSANTDEIKLKIFKEANSYVSVSIQDYGIGIDKKDHQKIFERFYRVVGKSEETYPGFGIGLFIVKEILSQHDGYITIESEKDKGALFTFTLPCV